MKVGLSSGDLLKSKNDVLLFLTEEDLKSFKKSIKPIIYDLIHYSVSMSSFKAKLKDVLVVPVEKQPFDRVIVAGMGKKKDTDVETLRRAAYVGLSAASRLKIKSLATALPDLKLSEKEMVRALSDAFRLGNYSFDKYKTEKDSKLHRVSEIKIFVNKISKDLDSTLLYSKISCDATNLARDLQNENADDCNPNYLANLAKKIAKDNKLKIKVMTTPQLKKEGLNLLLAVAQGSRFPPYLVIMEYKGDKSSKDTTAIVGKGVTFDTGGLSIKTRTMEDMNGDMSGAATILAAIKAAAELKLKKNIIAVAAIAENAIGSNACKPGSVVKSYEGKTVQIDNTDAEGRMILADALAYVNKKYKPSRMLEFSTLTGSGILAIGQKYSSLFSTTEEIAFKLKAAGETSGDYLWEFPLEKDYAQYLKSDKADLNNISHYRIWGMGMAGHITAALFLKNFVGKTDWAHIDMTQIPHAHKNFYRPKGGTGFGVRLLLDYFNQK